MRHKNDPEFNAKLYGKQKFSFRKLTIGLCAVALGTTFYLSNGSLVHADEGNTNSEPASSEVVKTDSKETTSGQTSEKTASQGQDSASANQNNEVTTSNDKKSQDTSTKDANDTNDSDQNVTISTKDLGNSNVASSELNDSKVKKPVVLAKQENTDSFTSNLSKDSSNPTQIISGVNNGTITANIDKSFQVKDGDKVTVKFTGDLADSGKIKYGVGPDFSAGGFTVVPDSSTGTYTYEYSGPTKPATISGTFNFTGNITSDTPVTGTVGLQITLPDNTVINSDKYVVTVHKYVDKVEQGEILHGFAIGPKVVWTPKKTTGSATSEGLAVGTDSNGNTVYSKHGVTTTDGTYTEVYTNPANNEKYEVNYTEENASNIDPSELDGSVDDARLMQYGADFNFGGKNAKNTTLNPLQNVDASISVGPNEKIIVSSIKVFNVTDPNAISDATGTRADINNHYSSLTAHEDKNFENYIKSLVSSDGRSITIDQSGKGNFTVNGQDYSNKGAFFIQFDTQIKTAQESIPGMISKGDGTSITTTHYSIGTPEAKMEGTGNSVTQLNNTFYNTGSANLGDYTTESKSIDETINYVDENDPTHVLATKHISGTVIFSRNGVTDPNTKDTTWSNWSTGSFDAVTNAKVDGWEVDPTSKVASIKLNGTEDDSLATISKENVSSITAYNNTNAQNNISNLPTGASHIVITVPYKQKENKEQAHLYYYDDTDKKWITSTSTSSKRDDGLTINTSGDPDTLIDFGPEATTDYNNIINRHYQYVGISNGIDPSAESVNKTFGNNVYGNYDSTDNTADIKKDSVPQYFIVHFVHEVTKKNETKTITENIKYVDEDKIGSDKSAKDIFDAAQGTNGYTYEISPEYTSSVDITLTRVKYTDSVNGNIAYSAWSIANKFNRVINPSIKNYTIDANKIYEEFNGNNSSLASYDKNAVHSVNGGLIKKQYNNVALTALKDESQIQVVIPYTENTHREKQTRTITENIKYVDEDAIAQDLNVTNPTIKQIYAAAIGKDGSKYELAPEYNSPVKIVLTRYVTVNDVNPKDVTPITAWSIANAFPAVAHPSVSGYTVDAKKIGEAFDPHNNNLATHNATEIGRVNGQRIKYLFPKNLDDIKDGAVLQVVVPYKKNPQPVNPPTQPTNPTSPTAPTNNPSEPTSPTNPSAPTQPVPVHPEQPTNNPSQPTQIVPVHPENPNNPTQPTKIVPVHPENINVPTKQSKTNTSSHAHVEKLSNVQPKAEKTNAKTLPQTGEKQNQLGILGLGIAAIAALLGLASDRKRKNS